MFSSQKAKKPRSQSGYLVFSHEMRAAIRKEHPEYAFGEISRIIGVEVIKHAAIATLYVCRNIKPYRQSGRALLLTNCHVTMFSLFDF